MINEGIDFAFNHNQAAFSPTILPSFSFSFAFLSSGIGLDTTFAPYLTQAEHGHVGPLHIAQVFAASSPNLIVHYVKQLIYRN